MTELNGFELNKAIAKELLNQMIGATPHARFALCNSDVLYLEELDGKPRLLPNWAGDTDLALGLCCQIAHLQNRVIMVYGNTLDEQNQLYQATLLEHYEGEYWREDSDLFADGNTPAEALARLALKLLRKEK